MAHRGGPDFGPETRQQLRVCRQRHEALRGPATRKGATTSNADASASRHKRAARASCSESRPVRLTGGRPASLPREVSQGDLFPDLRRRDGRSLAGWPCEAPRHTQTGEPFKRRTSLLYDPQPGVANGCNPKAAMCVRNVDVHVSCSSHVDAQFAASFIDPRAE